MDQFPVVRFRVRYRLGEYLQFMGAQGGLRPARRQEATPGGGWKLLTLLLGPFGFLYAMLRQGSCYYYIDQGGLRRWGRDGVLCVPWEEVRGIRRVEPGYLVDSWQGCVFLPTRALSSTQKENLARLLQHHAALEGGEVVAGTATS